MEKIKDYTETNLSVEWPRIVSELSRSININPNSHTDYIQILWLIHHIVLDEDFEMTDSQKFELESNLKKYFVESKNRFVENAEYLFFVGSLILIAEYLFDLKNTEEGNAMLFQATILEPSNILYRWAYDFTMGSLSSKTLARRILNSQDLTVWLLDNGYPGKYILGSINWDLTR